MLGATSCALFHFAEAIDLRARLEVLELEQWPDLDFRFPVIERGIREALRPLQRLFTRVHLDHRVTRHELLGLRERAIDHATLVTRIPDSPSMACGLEPGRVAQYAGFLKLFVKGRHLGEEFIVRHHAGFAVLRRFYDDHEAHSASPVNECVPEGKSAIAGVLRKTRSAALRLPSRRARPAVPPDVSTRHGSPRSDPAPRS